jgi:hypothetical protein
LKDHIDAVYALAFTLDGSRLVSGAADRTVKIWDTATGERLYTLGEPLDGLNTIALSPDGKRVAAGGLDKTIRVWSLGPRSGALLHSLIAHEDAICASRGRRTGCWPRAPRTDSETVRLPACRGGHSRCAADWGVLEFPTGPAAAGVVDGSSIVRRRATRRRAPRMWRRGKEGCMKLVCATARLPPGRPTNPDRQTDYAHRDLSLPMGVAAGPPPRSRSKA